MKGLETEEATRQYQSPATTIPPIAKSKSGPIDVRSEKKIV
jgi:hypothetical protein